MNKRFPVVSLACCSLLMFGCINEDRSNCPILPAPGTPYLNVSDDTPNVYDGAVTRITFSTNQVPVFISEEGYLDESGNSTFTVNEFFDDLAGEGAVNIHYDPETEQGYIDIASLSDDVAVYIHRLTLNAGNLTQQLTITTDITELATWASYPWVGTFHRWNQTGERVISSSSAGAWSAEVMTDEGDFVILNRAPSPATITGKLRTNDPGDAESYQVPDNVTSVSGNGRIFFRVGMKTRLGSSEDHRYTRIRVNWKDGDLDKTSYVYVRQGEAADYLMRPEDELTGSSTAPSRDLAVKYTAYNITDPLRGGGPSLADHSPIAGREGVFTDYPSKAGYLFLWNLSNDPNYRRALNPAIPASGIAILDWAPGLDLNLIYPAWNEANEVCPVGYRHVSDGDANTTEPLTSEIRQSLFLNPHAGVGVDDLSNSIFGFYADGWFDRQEVSGAVSGAYIPIATVGHGADVAYDGRIYYNPITNASLFFPAGGGRASNNGSLGSDGIGGIYWTSSSWGDLRRGVFMQVSYARMNDQFKNNACFVRCIKEE